MMHDTDKKEILKVPEFVYTLGEGTGFSIKELMDRKFELCWAQIHFPVSDGHYSNDQFRKCYRIWLNSHYQSHYHSESRLIIRLNKHVELTSKDFFISHEIGGDDEPENRSSLIPKPEFEDEYGKLSLPDNNWVVKLYVNVNCIFLPHVQKKLLVRINQKSSKSTCPHLSMRGYATVVANRGDMYVLKVSGPFRMK